MELKFLKSGPKSPSSSTSSLREVVSQNAQQTNVVATGLATLILRSTKQDFRLKRTYAFLTVYSPTISANGVTFKRLST